MSRTVFLIYKHILKKDGTIADIRQFIDVWYEEDMCRHLPVGADWNAIITLWPEFATAVFLKKYLNDE